MKVQWYLGVQLFLAINILTYEPSLKEIFVPRYDKKFKIRMSNFFLNVCLLS